MKANQREVSRKAYTEMVAWIAEEFAKCAYDELPNHPTLINLVVDICGESSLENMSYILWSCGCISPYDPEYNTSSGSFPRSFRYVVSRDQIKDKVRSAFDTGPSFDCVLKVFIGRAVDFRGLATDRTPFTVDQKFAIIMQLIHKLDYASKQEDLYRWNDTIGPIMVENGFWTEDGQSVEALAQAEFQRRVGALPEPVRRHVASFAASGKFINAVAVLRKDTGWDELEVIRAVDFLHPDLRSAK